MGAGAGVLGSEQRGLAPGTSQASPWLLPPSEGRDGRGQVKQVLGPGPGLAAVPQLWGTSCAVCSMPKALWNWPLQASLPLPLGHSAWNYSVEESYGTKSGLIQLLS